MYRIVITPLKDMTNFKPKDGEVLTDPLFGDITIYNNEKFESKTKEIKSDMNSFEVISGDYFNSLIEKNNISFNAISTELESLNNNINNINLTNLDYDKLFNELKNQIYSYKISDDNYISYSDDITPSINSIAYKFKSIINNYLNNNITYLSSDELDLLINDLINNFHNEYILKSKKFERAIEEMEFLMNEIENLIGDDNDNAILLKQYEKCYGNEEDNKITSKVSNFSFTNTTLNSVVKSDNSNNFSYLFNKRYAKEKKFYSSDPKTYMKSSNNYLTGESLDSTISLNDLFNYSPMVNFHYIDISTNNEGYTEDDLFITSGGTMFANDNQLEIDETFKNSISYYKDYYNYAKPANVDFLRNNNFILNCDENDAYQFNSIYNIMKISDKKIFTNDYKNNILNLTGTQLNEIQEKFMYMRRYFSSLPIKTGFNNFGLHKDLYKTYYTSVMYNNLKDEGYKVDGNYLLTPNLIKVNLNSKLDIENAVYCSANGNNSIDSNSINDLKYPNSYISSNRTIIPTTFIQGGSFNCEEDEMFDKLKDVLMNLSETLDLEDKEDRNIESENIEDNLYNEKNHIRSLSRIYTDNNLNINNYDRTSQKTFNGTEYNDIINYDNEEAKNIKNYILYKVFYYNGIHYNDYSNVINSLPELPVSFSTIQFNPKKYFSSLTNTNVFINGINKTLTDIGLDSIETNSRYLMEFRKFYEAQSRMDFKALYAGNTLGVKEYLELYKNMVNIINKSTEYMCNLYNYEIKDVIIKNTNVYNYPFKKRFTTSTYMKNDFNSYISCTTKSMNNVLEDNYEFNLKNPNND